MLEEEEEEVCRWLFLEAELLAEAACTASSSLLNVSMPILWRKRGTIFSHFSQRAVYFLA